MCLSVKCQDSFFSDTDLRSVPAAAAKNPPEGDLCRVRGLGFRAGLGVFETFLLSKQPNCKGCISLSLLFAEF